MTFIQEFKYGMQSFGKNIAGLVNTVLLFLVYLFGIGITSIIAKLIGKKFLDENLSEESYWKELNLKTEKKENYFRQF